MILEQQNYGSSINSFIGNTYDFFSKPEKVLITEPSQSWHDEAVRKLDELVRLENGWDGYQGLPVTFENAYFALRILEAICRSDAQLPQIVPGSSGDLQLEWHTFKGDIELHVKAPNDVLAWHSQFMDGSEERTLNLTFDFTDVANWVKKITEIAIAIEPAAA